MVEEAAGRGVLQLAQMLFGFSAACLVLGYGGMVVEGVINRYHEFHGEEGEVEEKKAADALSLGEAIQGRGVRFKGYDCALACGYYGTTGRLAIQLVEVGTGGRVATATVNVEEFDDILADDEVFIKDYGENTGMMEALVAAGILEPTGDTVTIGFVTAKVARILSGTQGPRV
jgi:hypothetical protein